MLATLALVVALSLAALTRRVTFAPAMRWPLIGLTAVVALAPSAHGAADFIDARLAVLLAYLVLASLRGLSGRVAQGWAVALAVVVVVARLAAARRYGPATMLKPPIFVRRSASSRRARGRWSSRRRPGAAPRSTPWISTAA